MEPEKDMDSDTLDQLLSWTILNTILSHKQMILGVLKTSKEKLVFQLSDGKTSREPAQQFHMDKKTISKWWRIWIDLGIASPIAVKGGGIRAQRNFSLDDFGIEIPTLEQAVSQEIVEEA